MERVRHLERQETLRRGAKWAAYSIVGILLLAGAVYGFSKLPKAPAQVHWHAKYRVYVDGRLVSFANPGFDGMKYGDAHLHAPDYDMIHNEGREGRGTLGSFFAYQLGGKFTDNELVIPQGASMPGEYKVNDTEKLRVFSSNQVESKDWREVTSGGLGNIAFHDADRFLILYGNYTSDEISNAEAQFPDFAGIGANAKMPTATTRP